LTATYDAHNHAGGEDSNGNPGSIYLPADGSSYSATYDVENRLVSTGSSAIFYSYAPGNSRVWKGTGSFVTNSSGGSGQCNTAQWTTDEVTFWGVTGQKLATYQLTESPNSWFSACDYSAAATGTDYYFGARLIKNPSGWLYPDRQGSIGKYFPYGQERPYATMNGTEKFTGYFRDSETGNDYAVNRFMTPGMGRFITPDRGTGGAVATSPGSWNKYAYTGGDPINHVDRQGADYTDDDPTLWDESPGFDLAVALVELDPDTPCAGDVGTDPDDPTCEAYLGMLFPSFFATPPADPTPPTPTTTTQTINFDSGDMATLTSFSNGTADTLGFQSGGAAGTIAEWICATDPICVGTVLIGGAVVITIGPSNLAALLDAITNVFQTKSWPPCIPPVGTIAYRLDRVPPSRPHWPFKGDHMTLYKMSQNPNSGYCFWSKIGVFAPPPPPGAIPMTGPAGGGTN
jgi:RHS repeat-associated protein